ncbi:phosphopantetheine-binding protein [Brevibacterium gallinarum]|uniref:Isochorismatase n=1 Tax=Brevibacterium gallinarum TaxID=2762220 RepID=A0ABR8WSN2_9MICO|nr:phosphopantetheine-binding protein [Brevibacterium gallinarum]MBD8019903.1 isochorismatase [Brevibacterium gallinarum]
MTAIPLNRAEVLAQLSEAADGEPVTGADEIFDLGIDSIRLMRLTDRWRTVRPDLDFADIATARTVDDLLDVLDVNEPAAS